MMIKGARKSKPKTRQTEKERSGERRLRGVGRSEKEMTKEEGNTLTEGECGEEESKSELWSTKEKDCVCVGKKKKRECGNNDD